MANTSGDITDLTPLFKKLGHKLEEIRVRALNSLLFKLEHELLCEADLVQERILFIKLLEWFNFPTCPQQGDVLRLLFKLTKNASAASLVVEIGGVEFLTQLRPNSEAALHPVIDGTLDQLFHLPSSPPVRQSSAECVYKSIPQDQVDTHQHTVTTVTNQSTISAWSSRSGRSMPPDGESRPSPTPVAGGVQARAGYVQPATLPSPPDSYTGYFDHANNSSTHPSQPNRVGVSAPCFRFSTFPWIALMPTDIHVLSSTDRSLRNQNASSVVSACQFLSDVVFQDFPAEVFLQRPSIVKSLLSLVSVSPVDSVAVAEPALLALHDLALALQARIRFYQDPALYTPKQDFSASRRSSYSSSHSNILGSTDVRPPLVGRSAGHRPSGDGQDGDLSPRQHGPSGHGPDESGMEDLDYDNMAALQFSQWSLPQFAVAALHAASPVLAAPSLDSAAAALQLLQPVVALLREALVPELLWQDTSVVGLEIIEQLQESFEILADAVQQHHHASLTATTPTEHLEQHQIALIGTASFVTELLCLCVPLDKVEMAMPELSHGMVTTLSMDPTLAVSHPQIGQRLLPYLQRLSPVSFDQFQQAELVCKAQQATSEFLNKWPEGLAVNPQELVDLAEVAVSSLSYHQHLPFIDACVELASHVCVHRSTAEVVVDRSRQLILGLLAHPVEHIRARCYSACLEVIKKTLGVDVAANSVSPQNDAAAITFLIHPHVLYEFTCFGLNDTIKKIEELAKEIMLHLLQGQLLMPARRWQQFLDAVTPVLPVLQGCASLEKGIGTSIVGLLETDANVRVGVLPLIERIRGTLRLMYRQETRLRTEGLGRLAAFLSMEEDCTRKLPHFADLQVGDLTNMFIVAAPMYLQDEGDDRSVFQEDGLKKVFDIFASTLVENDVKKASVDQLGIMLQDGALHEAFVRFGGLPLILSHLRDGVRRPNTGEQNATQTMLPSIVKILRHLVQRDFSFRHQLAHEADIYYSVVRSALMYSGDEDTRREAAHLLALLLWDEVASTDLWNPRAGSASKKDLHFSLPNFVTNRFRLPFRCLTHHACSPYRRPVLSHADVLQSGLLAQTIRLNWQAAWCGDVEALAKECAQGTTDPKGDNGYTGPLQLKVADRTLLVASCLPVVVQRLIHAIQNATSHSAAARAITGLRRYLVVSGARRLGPVLVANRWTQAIDRFLRVRPSSSMDESLLTDLLRMLCQLLSAKDKPDADLLTWLSGVLHNEQGALVTLLAQSEPSSSDDLPEAAQQTRRLLNRQLLKFIHVFIGKLPYALHTKVEHVHQVRGVITHAVLSRLSSSNATHFYNLASLERTLLALIHITARPGWSIGSTNDDSLTLCLQMLNTLLEVVAAFHVGRGSVSMSYMGRGVTRGAALSLRHLAYEMATQLNSQDWPRNWLFCRQGASEAVGESGFEWLTTLWTYRDTEVRAAGLGIAVALTSTNSGRLTMATQCQHIEGGLWGAAFSILLDHAECSLVRQQAALLLVNLTSSALPDSQDDVESMWRGPVIRNDKTQESLVGLPALLALLHHTQFYSELLVLLSNYYPQPTIHPVSVASTDGRVHATAVSSPNTVTTSGSGTVAGGQDGGWKPVTSTPLSDESSPHPSRPQSARQVPPPPATPASTASHTPTSEQDPVRAGAVLSESTSSTVVTVADYHSVVGPGLVGVVAQLLQNLVYLAPEDVITCLSNEGVLKMMTSVINVRLLEAYVSDLSSVRTVSHGQLAVALANQLKAHTAVLSLLQACITLDADVLQQFMHETTTLRQLPQLLAVSIQEGDIGYLCAQLWVSVLTFLRMLLQQGGQTILLQLTPVLTRHWYTLAARCVNVLQTTSYIDSPLWFAVLYLLAVLFSEEGRAEVAGSRPEDTQTITYRLETAPKNEGSTCMMAGPSGSVLCSALVRVYDTVSLQHGEQAAAARAAVCATLKCLLTISVAAKDTALEAGLMETLCDQLRHQTSCLNMDALETPKSNKSNTKKEQTRMTELVLTIDLLRNFMYNNFDVKLAAHECGFGQCLHKLWAWTQVDPPLLSSVLSVLATFTARCPQAVALPGTGTSTTSGVGSGGGSVPYSQNSLVHCLIKLARRESGSVTPAGGAGGSSGVATLKAVFAVLTTLTLSQECRGVLWKSNFLHEFSTLSPKRSKKTRVQQATESCWLRLILNLSFSTDGQSMLLKVKDTLSLLVEYADGPSDVYKRCAILTLRNLCFHAPNKSKLLANARIGPLLVENAEDGGDHVRRIATSAILALTYNCQKGKVFLKTTATVRRLQETYNSLVHLANKTADDNASLENLKNVLYLLKS